MPPDLKHSGWGLPGLCLLVGIADWPFWVDGNTELRWASLWLFLPLLAKKPKETLGLWALCLWLGLSLASMVLAPDFWYSVNGLSHLVILTLAMLAIGGREIPWTALALGLSVSVAFALPESFGRLNFMNQAAPPGGLFSNKDMLGEALALCLVGLGGKKSKTPFDWALLAILSLGIALTTTRAAYLGLTAAGLYFLWGRSKAAAITLLNLGVIYFLFFANAQTFLNRVIMWVYALRDFRPLGHGLGSFYSDFPGIIKFQIIPPYPDYPHNEVVNWVFEYGIGAILPLGFFAWLWSLAAKPQRPLLVCAGTISMFAFPLHNPESLLILGLALGQVLAQERPVARGALASYWSFSSPRSRVPVWPVLRASSLTLGLAYTTAVLIAEPLYSHFTSIQSVDLAARIFPLNHWVREAPKMARAALAAASSGPSQRAAMEQDHERP